MSVIQRKLPCKNKVFRRCSALALADSSTRLQAHRDASQSFQTRPATSSRTKALPEAARIERRRKNFIPIISCFFFLCCHSPCAPGCLHTPPDASHSFQMPPAASRRLQGRPAAASGERRLKKLFCILFAHRCSARAPLDSSTRFQAHPDAIQCFQTHPAASSPGGGPPGLSHVRKTLLRQ